MAKQKKRLARLADAVSSILGDEHKARKLQKAKALDRFIGKLEERRKEIERDLSKGSYKGKEADERKDQLRILRKQIKKGKKILTEMK